MEWIKFKDQKITEDGIYWIARESGSVYLEAVTVLNGVAGWYTMGEFYKFRKQTHWMKLEQPEPPREENGITFDQFWSAYPRKVNKHKCKIKWNRMSQKDRKAIMDALPRFLAHKPFADYTHPFPYTFLNGRRWEDELPEKNTNNGMVY